MLDGLRLRNFRSLADSGLVQLRPITLLLGQNSSGKSTFLRSLPLMRQSLRIRSSAPLLWYGDLVDFGSFREVKSSFADDKQSIGISFHFNSLTLVQPYRFTASPPEHFEDVELGISLIEIDDATRLSALEVRVADDTAQLTIDGRGIVKKLTVNNHDLSRFLPRDRIYVSHHELVPQMYLVTDTKGGQIQAIQAIMRPGSITEHEIFNMFSQLFDRRVSSGTIRSLSRRLSYAPGDRFREKLSSVKLSLKSWQHVKGHLAGDLGAKQLDRLRALYFAGTLPDLLSSINQAVSTSLRDLAYVGPSRATGERYYRHQELAIDQIDPQGQNLAMFLYSLTPLQRQEFSTWLKDQIGYEVQVDRQSGHVRIELREAGSPNFHNLADMGYGFSQILPVMAQIWGRDRHQLQTNSSSPFIAIEQPELHLHPAYQARIADVLASAIKLPSARRRRPICFVVETHSEALVNRLGELIYNGKLSADSVAIYLFHRMTHTDATEISRSNFNDKGILTDWPLEFFSSQVSV